MFFAAASPPRFATLAFVTGLAAMTLNFYLPSLTGIAADLETDYALVSLTISGYLGMTAILQLAIGPLSDRYGRRPVMLLCILLFAAASLGCALAENIWALMGFRVLQGSIVAGAALSRAVIRDTHPAREAASLIGYVGMAMAIAPMVGPLAGGVLDELFGWRAAFVALAAFGVAAFAVAWVDLGETNHAPSATLAAQMRSYPELFRHRRFWGYAACLALAQGGFFSFLAGAPLAALVLFDLSPSALGVGMGATASGFVVGSFIAGKFAKRHGLSVMILAGRLIAGAGLVVALAFYLADAVTIASFFGSAVLYGVGNGVTMPSANAGALSVHPRLMGSASGLSGALGVGGGAIMMTVSGAITTPENAGYAVHGMMLICVLAGLAAALYVRRLER